MGKFGLEEKIIAVIKTVRSLNSAVSLNHRENLLSAHYPMGLAVSAVAVFFSTERI